MNNCEVCNSPCRKSYCSSKCSGKVMKKKIEYKITENGCWECTSHKTNKGYPRARHEGKSWQLHRLVFILNNGEIPSELVVRHKCDNKLCININHLELGTNLDNIQDRQIRNRQANGEKIKTSKLTEKQVIKIRESKLSSTVLGKQYGVSHSTILRIKSGETWRHLKKEEV